MANVALHLSRLQLGAAGSRHRRAHRLAEAPSVSTNASSISLQCSSVRQSLLPSLQCPKDRVLTLKEDPVDPFPAATPAFQVAFAHNKNLLVAVDEDGVACVADAASARRKGRWSAHRNAIFDVIWTWDDTQVLTAAGDLQIRVWDVETAGQAAWTSSAPVATFRGHDMSVKCVRQAPDNAHVFASGGRDGRVLMWDTRATGKPVASMAEVHAEPAPSRSSSPGVSFSPPEQKRRRRGSTKTSSSPRSATCVEFGASGHELITAGAVDAVVKFWDVRRFSSGSGQGKKKASSLVPTRQFSCSTREGARRGISSLELRPGGVGGAFYLLVNVLNDAIAVVDIGQNQHCAGHHEARTLLRCTGHRAGSFYSKATFSPDGDFIAGASTDGIVYVWDARISASSSATPQSTWSGIDVGMRLPYLALKGHASEVNGVAWNYRDFTQLASCSDDGTVRCWHVGGRRDLLQDDQHQDFNAKPEAFELQRNENTEEAQESEWANWSAFVEQPDGYAYRVRAAEKRLPASPKSVELRSITHRKERLAGASPQIIRRTNEPRLHPVHVAPSAQQQPQSQEAQENPLQKRRIRLQRKPRPAGTTNRAQRTLLDLWGKSRPPAATRAQRTFLELWGK